METKLNKSYKKALSAIRKGKTARTFGVSKLKSISDGMSPKPWHTLDPSYHLHAKSTFDRVARAAQKIWHFPDGYFEWMTMRSSPYVVVFVVESIPFKNQPRDPYSFESTVESKRWDRLVEELEKDPWITEAGWESLSSTKVRVYVKPLIVS